MAIEIRTEIKKVICETCGIEKNLEKNYYLSRFKTQERMKVCKDCFIEEIRNTGKMLDVFKKYNIPFLYDLWESLYVKHNRQETVGEYMSKINSLPQYRNLEWKDSVLDNSNECENKKEVNFYDDIVANLQKEAKILNKGLEFYRTKSDMNLYISTLKSLRETLELIAKYDWKLMYSQYSTPIDGNLTKQIAVWEQNHDNQIRNYKVWNTSGTLTEFFDDLSKDWDDMPSNQKEFIAEKIAGLKNKVDMITLLDNMNKEAL